MDRDDGVGEVVLTAEHLAGLGAFDLLLELLERAPEIAGHIFTSARPLDEHTDVVGSTLE
jgi:hypothetical protein